MSLAAMFKPIRGTRRLAADADPAPARSAADPDDRVGRQIVTNPSPSGLSVHAPEEDAWLALLELVFDATGWPDAET